jgi:5'-nucleotidase / UDP-sugar diphosphatase
VGRPSARRSIRLVHFADYHAHAVPFYADGQTATAGLARLIAYLRSVRPHALVTNGGDMFNVGSPAWSDRYQGREWPWFNGLVDVMALGNHDSDYGPAVFGRSRRQLDHPILCANLVDGAGAPVLTARGRTYLVREIDGVRVGFISAAGPDIAELVPPAARPVPGARFVDRVPIVEELVAQMRGEDRVDVVAVIGHALHEDDVALARAVPGIDLVLGTHSHRLQELTTIDGTEAVTISPFQYGTYVADLRLELRGGALVEITGGLVRMDQDRPEAPDIAAQVAVLHHDLTVDPAYAYLLEEIGHADTAVGTDGGEVGESPLGNLVSDVVREATGTDVALLTASTMREAIPPGPVRVDDVLTALPYPNQLVVFQVAGRTLQAMLDVSLRHRGTNFHAQVSGLRFTASDRGASDVMITDRGRLGSWLPLDLDRSYSLVTNDFTAEGAPGYRDLLAGVPRRAAGLELRETLIGWVRRTGHVEAQLDGRITQRAAPAVAG